MQTQTNDAPPSQHTDHTHLVQMLSAMMIQLNALQALVRAETSQGGRGVSLTPPSTPHYNLPDIDAIRDGLNVLEQMTREALHQARSIDEDELLAELIGVTFPEALSNAVEEAAERLGLSSRIAFSGEERTLPSYTESLLYRIAQEALYQVQQRTGTRKLRLVLTYGYDEVLMSIEHDGVAGTPVDDIPAPPFAPPLVTTDAVLNDLRQRIEHLGGSLEVSSRPYRPYQPGRRDVSLPPPSTQEGQLSRIQARVPYIHHTHNALDRDLSRPYTHNPVGADLSRPSPQRSEAERVSILRPAGERVRVLVVEAQAVTRAGLRRLLESYPDLQVLGEAADGVQAVSETLELGPQVVLMDMQLPNGQSLEALRQIKQLNLNTQVLLLSALDREEYLYEALRAGAGGYVLKDIAPDELAQAVRTVARGEVLLHPQLARRLLSQFSRQTRGNSPYEALTAREQEVLRLLARGLRNKEMAARLHVSERTINFHLANIYQKLNVSGRTEALSKALEQGLITA
jgi:DNA-binding NarL/FixJ family response regulator